MENRDNKSGAFSMDPCSLCPRECGARRSRGERGYCLADDRILLARAALHMWEEPCISGEKGSGAVFFSGCNLRCVYCQNYEIAAGKGVPVTTERLSEIFLALQQKGAANINLVTPDPYVLYIIDAVRQARSEGLSLPVVYNGSGYEKGEVIRQLQGTVDIFLTDFKYWEPELAEKYSFARDYPERAREALSEMVKLTGPPVFDSRGMMQRGVIVRHLLLPGHKRNAKAVVQYLSDTYGDGIYISLMNQYTPFARLEKNPQYKELCRRVTKREYESVVDYAIEAGVKNAYIQTGETAGESFIPDFDFEGI